MIHHGGTERTKKAGKMGTRWNASLPAQRGPLRPAECGGFRGLVEGCEAIFDGRLDHVGKLPRMLIAASLESAARRLKEGKR